MASASEGVARYYDRNTGRFLLVGRGRDTLSIHRELWGPGVASAAEAARYVDRLVGDEIQASTPGGAASLVDFGCGVGGTMLYLARRFPDARVHGVTISAKQVGIARRLLAAEGLGSRCQVSLGDFHATDLGTRAEAVVATEALAHSRDLESFLSNVVRHLGRRGILVVVDDFLAAPLKELDSEQRRRVEELRDGWHLHGLSTVDHVVAEARGLGLALRKDVDLTRYTRPGSRLRDRIVALCSPVLIRLGLLRVPFWGNVIGGNALQIGLKEGFIRYRLLVFERSDLE